MRTITAKIWTLSYTEDGQLWKVTNPDLEVTDHQYLSDGRPKRIVVKSTDATHAETRDFYYQDTDDSFNCIPNKNRHLRQTWDRKKNGQTICKFAYDLDPAGNRLGMTHWDDDNDSEYLGWTYDPNYQVRSETKYDSKTDRDVAYGFRWLYDGNGNRITQHDDGVETSYTYGDNNQMTDAGSDDFTYDQFGNTKTKVSGGNTTTYNYDFEGHLTSIDYPGTSNDDTHEYDGDGRRMRGKLAGASEWTNFIYDELTDELICEYTLISGTFTIKSLNTWGLGLISTNREGTKRYFHFDGLGSTWALTDSSEVIQDTYTYSAFGVVITSSGSSVNPFRFVGRFGAYDDGARGSASNFVYFVGRFYSPILGRIVTGNNGGFYGQGTSGGGVGVMSDVCPQHPPGVCFQCWKKKYLDSGWWTEEEACEKARSQCHSIIRCPGDPGDGFGDWFWRWWGCFKDCEAYLHTQPNAITACWIAFVLARQACWRICATAPATPPCITCLESAAALFDACLAIEGIGGIACMAACIAYV